MIGFSVFLHQIDEEYIHTMANAGFQKVFSSLQLGDNDRSSLEKLADVCKNHELQLALDVHPTVFEVFSINFLQHIGIRCLRLDDGFNLAQMKKLSKDFKIILNASTVTELFISELINSGVKPSQLEAWHNYYPHPFTGLSERFFNSQNKFLHNYGIETAAFICGDTFRGPLFEGLPSLEQHRKNSPFSSYLHLQNSVNHVLIGDLQLSLQSIKQFKHFIVDDIIQLQIQLDKQFESIANTVYHNRPDEAEHVIRLLESRTIYKKNVSKGSILERVTGDITIDNSLFGRYEGEIQIVLKPLPSDERVNSIGKVIDRDITLLQHIHANQAIQMEVLKWI